jgi:SAM-dependent methyltransferase
MTTVPPSQLGGDDLARLYDARFSDLDAYRKRVWAALVEGFFQKLVPEAGAVLDIGCGWGGFINNVRAARRLGIDLNPSARQHLHPGVEFLEQSCSEPWPVADGTLDTVFTSNFLEHLPDKTQVKATLAEAFRTLKPGGALICMGPNIRYVGGAYWDFFDHHVPLTELSLKECLENLGFAVTRCVPKFLPYTMVNARPTPVLLVRLYLRVPLLWRAMGKQFLLLAEKPRHMTP